MKSKTCKTCNHFHLSDGDRGSYESTCKHPMVKEETGFNVMDVDEDASCDHYRNGKNKIKDIKHKQFLKENK